MIRIAILGDIGAGKSYIAKNFGYPVFNADKEVSFLYKKNRKIFTRLNKELPKYIFSFPIDKKQIINAILANNSNLKKIVKIVHIEVKKKMKLFLKKNRKKKIIILDIPLLLENNIYKKKDILLFVEAKKKDIFKRLKTRKNYNPRLLKKFREIQLPLEFKKKKSTFLIKNKFTKKNAKINISKILKKIL
tara:strand:- start:5714 stop:6283 length:570 start_codon:yes stop_codon:yes gene_type:complete